MITSCLPLPLQVTLRLVTLSLQVTLHLLPLSLQVNLCLLLLPVPQDQMILMSVAFVYLLSLPLVFDYFLHITLPRLKMKNLSMKNRINHQNDVICFRSDDLYNKYVIAIAKTLKNLLGMGCS